MNLDDINVEKELKIIFMGTPEFSVPVLESLIQNYKVKAVVTQSDKEVGRGGKIIFSPVKKCAMDHTILVLQPKKIKEIVPEIIAMEPDLIITCAYGQFIPPEILRCARLGCINVHASLLPKYRGGAPIHRAIMSGAKKTGITIMYMNSELDAGDIISQAEVDITETDTASTLHDKLKDLGAKLLMDTLPSIIDGTCTRTPQDKSQVSYAFVITRNDEKISFDKTKREIYNQIRGLNSWPGSYCTLDEKILKVWEARISENFFPGKFNGEITAIYDDGIGVKVENGEIVLTKIQMEGKRAINARDFVNGYHEDLVGKILR